MTEWYYKNVVHKFISDVREGDPSSNWTPGAEVTRELIANTVVDSELSMMTMLKKPEIEKLDNDVGNVVVIIAAAATGSYSSLDKSTIFSGLMNDIQKSSMIGNINQAKEDLHQKE